MGEARTRVRQTTAALAQAEDDVARGLADLGAPGVDNPRLRRAAADLELVQLNLDSTKVWAPTDGYVTNLQLRVGDSAVTNQPMLALIDANSFYVQAFFRETFVGNFQKGDRAVVTLMSYPDTPLEGSVDSIGWGIAQQNGSTAPTLLRWRVPRHGLPVVARLASPLQRPQRSSRASRFVSNDCRLSLRLNRAASPFFSSLLCEALHTLRPGRFSMLFGDRPETARANERCRPAIDQKNGRTRDGYQF